MVQDHPGGRPSEYTTEEVLAVFDRREDEYEPLTSREVADELGCTRSTAFGKLTGLDTDGFLKTKRVGARARVWWK